MASYLPNLTRDNLSLYAIPAAWAVAMMPKIFAASYYNKATGKSMDSVYPRGFTSQVNADQALDSKTRGRVLRAEAAQQNGYENLGLFAAAVVAGNVAKLSPGTLNGLSLGYLTVRFLYNHLYIFGDLVPAATRSVAWLTSVGMCFTLFVQAGNRMKNTIL